METLEIWCSVGKVPVTIGESFNWSGIHSGVYKVKKWGDRSGMYSPSGIGGTISVWVENANGQEIEWCGDSVALGVFLTKNPNYYKNKVSTLNK